MSRRQRMTRDRSGANERWEARIPPQIDLGAEELLGNLQPGCSSCMSACALVLRP